MTAFPPKSDPDSPYTSTHLPTLTSLPLNRYVLYKERNVLLTEEYACKRNRVTMPAPHRKTMVGGSVDA